MDKLSIYGKIHHIACCRLKSHASGALRSLVNMPGCSVTIRKTRLLWSCARAWRRKEQNIWC